MQEHLKMAINDYAGKYLTMESFTAQTTDGSAELDLTLQDTPSDDNNIYIFCGTSGYIAEFGSRAAKVVTVVIKKLKYDKIDIPITGSLGNLPGGVSESASKINTDAGGGSSQDNPEAGSGNSATPGHAHGISKIYQHDHSPGFTETAMPLATSQAGLTITIAYVFTI